jgi:ubiquitin carboxyl-terminal hydrolase 5/13
VLAFDSAERVEDVSAWVADQDIRVSEFALTLQQVNNGKKIPPSGWKCEMEECDMTQNLWMNLTDGTILCGRKYADGSGGNGHALAYYKQTGFPLCVKLATITADGGGGNAPIQYLLSNQSCRRIFLC